MLLTGVEGFPNFLSYFIENLIYLSFGLFVRQNNGSGNFNNFLTFSKRN